MADFDKAYTQKMPQYFKAPPPRPMIGSYPEITPVGQTGDFFVNTYYLRPDRKLELPGPIPVTHLKVMRNCNNK